MKSTLYLTTLALACFAAPVAAENPKVGFLNLVHKDPDGKEAKYVLFVPHDYKGDKDYPLILFLHGSGETGTDGIKQAATGLGSAIKKQEKTFPFFAVFPQSQKRTWDADSDDGTRAMAILEEVQKQYKIDPKRIYLTGLSMGGVGTWSFAAKYPEKWAAIVPICGGGDVAKAAVIKDLPCWCFWGDQDTFAVPAMSKTIKAIEDAGGKPKQTVYEGVGHNSWDKAYATKELYEWLLMQHKK